MIGKTVSHYEILEKLGGGGMGVVYKAHDLILDRTVALKFLPPDLTRDPEAKQRFVHEAKAASALDHQNICNVHDIGEAEDGEMFIVMACYEGETLQQKIKESIENRRLKIEDCRKIAAQVAEGLARAHEAGIVHRDIKPANIFLTTHGEVKILDFGLAKLAGLAALTKSGKTVGTIAYASPEQVRGEEVDQRSDIFSLGVVLYEMVTGHRPFRGEHEAAIMYSIMNEAPEPLTRYKADVPDTLQRVIDRSLAKKKENRYQHADEMLVDLRRVQRERPAAKRVGRKFARNLLFAGAGIAVVALAILTYFFLLPGSGPTGPQSVAVLPFVDMSPGKDQEYFCDGMTEELINRLTRIRTLRVPARTSAFMFKGKTEDIRDIGARLNVGTVLEGSVRKAGSNLRVTAQLINVADGYDLWSETYNRELKDIFAIQDEVASAIVNALQPRLTAEERHDALASRHNLNPEAYNFYLQGRFLRERNTHEDCVKALPYFQQAIEKDSSFALGWSGLADIYMMIDLLSGSQPHYYALSLAAAQKSLALDPALPQAYIALAVIQMCYEWNWSGAQQSIERAITLNERDAFSHVELGILLQRTGNYEASIPELKRSIELDPLAWKGYYRIGFSYSRLGNHNLAIEQFRKAIELGPGEFSKYIEGLIGWEYYCLGSYDKARALFNNATWLEVYVESARGNRRVALERIAALKKADLHSAATHEALVRAYACIGENDSAIVHLEELFKMNPMQFVEIKLQHECDGLYSHPRFIALLRRIGLHERFIDNTKPRDVQGD